ncbi:TADA3 [Lepeophtheirus salmonis]|uniref:TADA3 n=1 Tax=Lepeophtheirus salmonis TaxID=72036 RepID=A0A7R8CFK8_LEPSM|nr:TADA3 [Lepeophtheirus salmonis]CAF2807684.1 TADA3 [Lepeophtheirus salmonis]
MTKHLNKSGGTSRSPTKGKESPSLGKTLDLRDCPLTFPEFASVDHSQVVPRYSAVLKRNETEGITLEDVDALQMELEALLSSTVVRKMTLKEEHKNLSNLEKPRAGSASASRSAGKRGPSSPGKRAPEDRYGKKQRLNASEKKVAPNFDPLQNEQIRPVSESSVSPSPKNETPSRFWSFVEPYCAPITINDVQLLDDLIRTHDDLSEYFITPKKGKHYTRKWAEGEADEEEIETTNKLVPFSQQADSLEAHVFKELEEQGIFDSGKEEEEEDEEEEGGEDEEEDENDEILEELKRCQKELRALSSHNLVQLKRLMKCAKDEMVRQEMRNKLNEADKRVMEAYKKISHNRSLKKEPSKKGQGLCMEGSEGKRTHSQSTREHLNPRRKHLRLHRNHGLEFMGSKDVKHENAFFETILNRDMKSSNCSMTLHT